MEPARVPSSPIRDAMRRKDFRRIRFMDLYVAPVVNALPYWSPDDPGKACDLRRALTTAGLALVMAGLHAGFAAPSHADTLSGSAGTDRCLSDAGDSEDFCELD